MRPEKPSSNEKTCLKCGAVFVRGQTKPSDWRRRSYCSRACYSARGEAVPFWGRVDKTGPCWLWMGPLNQGGYGATHDGRSRWMAAHRRAWVLTHGAVPEGMWVLHRCDVRRCVNPEHLYLGSPKDNARDRGERFYGPRPVRSANARLSASDVRRIRELSAAGVTFEVLSKTFGCSWVNVSTIVRRLTWKHVE